MHSLEIKLWFKIFSKNDGLHDGQLKFFNGHNFLILVQFSWNFHHGYNFPFNKSMLGKPHFIQWSGIYKGIYGPLCTKTGLQTFATSKDLDLPAHPSSLMRLHWIHEEFIGHILSIQLKMETLVRLHGCAGTPEQWHLANVQRAVFSRNGPYFSYFRFMASEGLRYEVNLHFCEHYF